MMRLFKSKKSKREIYFHEDDYCQQQLLPAEAKDWIERELKEIDRFSREHQGENGIGWTDVYVRDEPSSTIVDLKITVKEIAHVLNDIIPRFDKVVIGYSTYREKCECTGAWGFNQNCAIFIEWNKDDLVTSIWTSFFDLDDKSIGKSAEALTAIGGIRPMLYVDWTWGYIDNPEDKDGFSHRLTEKLNKARENFEKLTQS